MIKGRCLCGTVRYELDGPLNMMVNCHCSMCRKHSGASYATFAAGPLEGYRILEGESSIGAFESSPGHHRNFCMVCGSVLPEAMRQYGLVVAPAGNLEGDLGIKPQMHIFTGSKAPWYAITDDLPQHESFPPEFAGPETRRPTHASREGVTHGSCLCGKVEFEITGKPNGMFHCHCSRCRRGRSAAHATNIFYKAEDFRWLKGETLVRKYRLPEARFFGTAFCSECGGGVPGVSTERNIAVVPAGSLDDDPGIRAQARIYVDSKPDWVIITDDVPQYAEGPPSR